MSKKGKVQTDTFVNIAWIAEHIDDPGIRLIELDVSPDAYNKGHIPGAIFWNAYADLRDKAYRPILSSTLQQLLSRSGITTETTIVFYGYGNSLGFWLMKAYGHNDVRMFEGSRDMWTESGKKMTTKVPQLEESTYPLPTENLDFLASRQTVEATIGNQSKIILDVRSTAEYKGERFWPSGATEDTGRSGHIPSAINVPIDTFREANGTLKSVNELQRMLDKSGVTKDKGVITYCTIGNRGSMAWFVLKYLLNFPSVRVYYGSWVEWGKLTETAIEL